MALPAILVPGNQPFLRDGFEFQPAPLYGDAPMVTGSARRRRAYISVPSMVSVSLERDEAGKDAFAAWYDGPLKAGGEFFSARIASPGLGLLYYKARFAERFTLDYLGGSWYRISAKLILFGDGTATAPTTSILTGGVLFDLLGDAVVGVTQPLVGGVTFDLTGGTAKNYFTGGVTFDLGVGTYTPPVVGVGAAAGTSTASGSSQLGAVGSAAGTSTAGAFVRGLAVGSAAGSSSVQAISTGAGRFYPSAGATWVTGTGALVVPINDVPFYAKRERRIVGVSVLTRGGPGSCVIDIWKATSGGYPPVLGGTICASAKPTLSSANTYFDTTLTGWDRALAAGDTLLFHLVSTSNFSLIKISLHFEEST